MVVRRIGLVAVVVVGAAVALTSCVQLVHNGFDDQHTVTEQVTEVRLRTGAGNVVVRSREGAAATEIRRRVEHPRSVERPSGVSYRVEGSTLVLDGCGSHCTVDYEVTVPSTDVRITGESGSGDVRFEGVAAVEVETGSGNAVVRKVSGPVRIDSGSGDVEVADVTGDFTGRVRSGNATLSDMRGTVTVDSSSGDVDVRMAAATSVRVGTGSGNLQVHVPRARYRVEVDTGSGDQEVAVDDDPNAPVELVLHTGSGDVVVRAV